MANLQARRQTIGPSSRIINSPHYKYWAFLAIAVGLFVTVLDQTGVNIALPRIAEHFSVNIPTVQWITLGYVLSTSALLMPMGRLSDIVGRKRVYMAGFVLFIGAAALGGTGNALLVLIVAKVIQGIGSAAIQANGMAMITDVFPKRERGKALGMYMTVIGTGGVSGPVVGGLLVSGLGWRSVFFASIPVALLALVLATAVLRGSPGARGGGASNAQFDWAGAGLSSAALVSFLLAMTNAHRQGWASPPILAGFLVALALMAAFLWWEHRAPAPMLDLGLFRIRVFSMGVSSRFLSFLGGSAVHFLMPFYLIEALGYSTSRAGLMMVPSSLCMAIAGPISGRLSDKFGTRWLTVVGMALSASALFTLSRLTVDSSPVHVVTGMALSGLGLGTFASPNTSAVMSSLTRESYGIASAFLNLTRTSANLVGIVLATTIVAVTMGSLGYEPSLAAVSEAGGEGVKGAFVTGLNRAFLVSGPLMVVAMVVSWLRGESQGVSPAPAAAAAPSRSSASAAED